MGVAPARSAVASSVAGSLAAGPAAPPGGRSLGSVTLSPRQVRELLDAHGLAPSRALGQNFVADPNTVRRIARLAEVGAGDRVVEIGPGLGSLTLALAETGAEVTAVELDRHLLPALREVVEPHGVRVVHGDALRLDWDEVLGPPDPERPWSLVANLPYNVATPLVLDLLANVPAITRMLVMVQREVGERLAAGPGTKAYGIPSVKVAYRADAEVVGRVPPTVFIPPAAGRVGARPHHAAALAPGRRRSRPPVPAGRGRVRPAAEDAAAVAVGAGRRGRVRAGRRPARGPGRGAHRRGLGPPGRSVRPHGVGPVRSDRTGMCQGEGVTDVLPAPAKLTVSLRVTGVRADGYHLIDAEMVSLDLADELTFDGGHGFEVVEGHHLGHVDPDDNLVGRALKAVGRDAHVTLRKRIPAGGGLGGGSSNAATVMRWAGCDDVAVAASLGADVPFCLRGGRARVTGIGEVLDPLPFEPRTITLAMPPFGCSTPAVYARVGRPRRPDRGRSQRPRARRARGRAPHGRVP